MIFGKHINKYYKKYFIWFLFGILALILVDWYQLKIPELVGALIDDLEKGKDVIGNGSLKDLMLRLAHIAIIMFVGRFGWRNACFGVAVKIEADMREDLFIKSEKLSQRYYKEHKTGALMALYTNDLSTIREVFGLGLIMLIDALFLGILTFYKMFKTNKTLSLLALIPMVIICVVSLMIGKVMEKKFELRQKAYEDLSDFTQENFSGISVIKAFVKEILEITQFKKINKQNQEININFAKFSTLLHVLLTLFIGSITALLYLGGSFVVIKGNGFTSGDLFKYVTFFATLVWPMMAVSQLINMRAQAKASLNRISRLLDEKVDIVDDKVVDLEEIKGSIKFNNLSFQYPDGEFNVLENISFDIKAGQMVGIVGRTGCGKTTIVDLLLRIYNVKENEIYLDGIDIMNIPFKKVRESIGYVPQDNFLFSDTIKNNIGFAFEEIDDDTIQHAATLADVHQNIEDFEFKYETILGERGVTLSGGQKQRVSIARALIKNPPILILDDSVSAVDTKTEEKILTNLRDLRKGKTTILIAHRISTVKDLDLVILMDEGRILDCGTHDELLSRSNEYQEMVRLQSLEAEVEGGAHDE